MITDHKILPRRVLVGFAVAILVAIASYLDWLARLDFLIYDWRSSQRVRQPSDQIVIVAIDEQSIAALGRWAWPRTIHAQLVQRLNEAGAEGIAFDLAFVEPDPHDRSGDALFSKAIDKHGKVILPILHEEIPSAGQIIETMPTHPLLRSTATLAHVDLEQDRDGVVRRYFLKAGVATPHWPALALALVQVKIPDLLSEISVTRRQQTESSTPFAWVRDHMLLVTFAGPPKTFPHVPYINVLQGNFDKKMFLNRLVIVGVTASGLGDRFMVPVTGSSLTMTGVELQANVADALLQKTFISHMSPISVSILTLFVIFISVILYEFIKPGWIVFLTALSLQLLFVFVAMDFFQLWFPPSAACLGLVFSFGVQAMHARTTDRKKLLAERDHAQASLNSISDGVFMTDVCGAIVYMNESAEDLTGCRFDEALGKPIDAVLDLCDPKTGNVVEARSFTESAESNDLNQRATVLKSRNGQIRDVKGTLVSLNNDAGRDCGMILAIADVTDVRQLARSLQFQATHDPLTELPNRKLFEQTLDRAVSSSHQDRSSLALIFVAIENFATINSTLGREAANAMIRLAGERLSSCMRNSDLVARIGEDSFGLIVANLANADAAAFLSHKVKKSLQQPFNIGGFRHMVNASIGVGVFPNDADDPISLVMVTERAVSRARNRRGKQAYFAAEMAQIGDNRRVRIRRTLRQAIKRNEMFLLFQPQIAIGSGSVVGVEALLRWSCSDGHIHAPPDIIAVAEELGLENAISKWVVGKACQNARSTWEEAGLTALRIAVNLSAKQFLMQGLSGVIQDLLERTNMPAHLLSLEITEETLIQDMQIVRRNMEQVRDLGIDIFVDDFGVGYASLLYLKELPVSGVKIDKSYVQDMLLEPQGAAIVRAVIALAHGMGIRVVAEGVETIEQLRFLRSQECDEAQGYLISPPLSASKLVPWLETSQKLPV